MIDVSVKTLDGQTKSHSVEEDITVRQFKDIISSSISIPADTQRLIFQGRVLQDEKLLRDYNVHNKVIHVVQRPPPRPNSSGNNGSSNSSTASAPPPPTRDVNSFVVGSFTLPSEILDPNQVQNIVQQAVHNMGELGRNARVSTRSSADGSAVDVHINLGQIPVQQINESQQRVNHIKKLLSQVKAVLSRLENPSTSSNGQSGGSNSSTGNSNSQGIPNTSEEPSDAEPDTSQASSSQQSNSETSNNQAAASPPAASVLVELMGEIQTVQRRLEPFLNQYTSIANNDTAYNNDQVEIRQNNVRTFNLVSESLHYLGHIYHGVSDLALDLNQSPPRHLHAHTALPTLPGLLPSGITPGSIPVQVNQAQYRMGGGSGVPSFTSTMTPRPSAVPSSTGGTSSGTSTVTSTITAPTAAAAAAAASASSSRSTPSATLNTTLPIRLPTLTSQTAGNLSTGTPLNLGQSFATSSSSPYLFVEVGPDSLTVNSISAHVVSSVDTTSTSTANTSSAQRTFQLNLDPSGVNAGQPASTPTPATTTSNAGSTDTSNRSSTSTSTTTTNALNSGLGVGPGRATVVLPGGMPNIQGLLGSQHNARTIDPYLPCMSRHFIASQTQNTMGANTGPTNNAGNVPNQQSSNQAADAALGDVVAAVMAGLLGTNESQTSSAPPDGFQPNTSSTPRPTTNPVTIPQFSQAIGGLASPVFAMVSRNLANMTRTGQTTADMTQEPAAFVQTLRNLLQGAARGPTVGVQVSSSGGLSTTTNSNTTASTNTSNAAQCQSTSSTAGLGSGPQPTAGNPNSQAIPDEAIAQLIRGISNNLTQAASGQQNVGTIWDVYSSIGDELDIEQFEGLNNDIFQCVARHFTIPDLMTVLLGNTEPLNRLRDPLRDLVHNRILNGAEPTEANVQNAVLQLLGEAREEIRVLVSIADVQPNIDAEGTLTNFLKHQYTKIIKLIIESEESFGSRLYDCFKRFLSELIVLGRHCLVGGYPAFQRLVHDRLHHLTNGINVVMQQSMITMATLQLNAFTPQQTEDDIVHYIVWKDSDGAAATPTVKKKPEAVRSEADGASSVSPMDVDTDNSIFSQNNKTDDKKDEGNRAHLNGVHMEDAAASTVAFSPSMEQEIAAASSNGDDWCNVVPAEWVPIIRQDIQQQRRQNSQAPFSDTYLSGMPAKRRKMNHGKASNLLNDGAKFVPDSLKRAVVSAGVEPLSSLENLSSEAAHDATLHSAFEEQICHNVLQRIHLDSDYNPEKFPNTEEYFKNQHGE